jgi:hypothetical protein
MSVEHNRWRDFSHTVDVLISSSLARDDMAPLTHARTVRFTMPYAVAASDRLLNQRMFPGGLIDIVEAEDHAHQVYIVLKLDDPSIAVEELLLTSTTGETAILRLDALDQDGIAQMLLDTKLETNATIVRLLRHPDTMGTFS